MLSVLYRFYWLWWLFVVDSSLGLWQWIRWKISWLWKTIVRWVKKTTSLTWICSLKMKIPTITCLETREKWNKIVSTQLNLLQFSEISSLQAKKLTKKILKKRSMPMKWKFRRQITKSRCLNKVMKNKRSLKKKKSSKIKMKKTRMTKIWSNLMKTDIISISRWIWEISMSTPELLLMEWRRSTMES